MGAARLATETAGTDARRPPSIRDVARLAGASIATVSYALRETAQVAMATRERVVRLGRHQMGAGHVLPSLDGPAPRPLLFPWTLAC